MKRSICCPRAKCSCRYRRQSSIRGQMARTLKAGVIDILPAEMVKARTPAENRPLSAMCVLQGDRCRPAVRWPSLPVRIAYEIMYQQQRNAEHSATRWRILKIARINHLHAIARLAASLWLRWATLLGRSWPVVRPERSGADEGKPRNLFALKFQNLNIAVERSKKRRAGEGSGIRYSISACRSIYMVVVRSGKRSANDCSRR